MFSCKLLAGCCSLPFVSCNPPIPPGPATHTSVCAPRHQTRLLPIFLLRLFVGESPGGPFVWKPDLEGKLESEEEAQVELHTQTKMQFMIGPDHVKTV
jgi:hypothetical protein